MEWKNAAKLVAVLAAIAGAIFFIEAGKPGMAPQPPLAAPAGENAIDFSLYPRAPELAGIEGYINAPGNLTIASLRGKVVLVDFWTYTCINCIRTLPYLNSWHEKYAGNGLAIIGVHTPEFGFEKDYGNVLAAVQKYGIKYPVALDNGYATWRAFGNSYWPHKYLLDAQGRMRYDHIGEGGYDETEAKIVELLSEAKNARVEMNGARPNATAVDFGGIRTPEIYFGDSFRRAPLGNAAPAFVGQEFDASMPAGVLQPNIPYLEGKWANGADAVRLSSQKGAIELVFTAKSVNIVAGSVNSTLLAISIDGKKVEKQDYCPDAPRGACTVGSRRLYTVVSLPEYGTHRLRIDAQGAGFELYTFTFG